MIRPRRIRGAEISYLPVAIRDGNIEESDFNCAPITDHALNKRTNVRCQPLTSPCHLKS